MSSQPVVFLDFDGTLADRGVVPPAHVAAVRAARARARVLLCTGRSKAMLTHEIRDIGFDGLVASAGCYVELDGTVLKDQRFGAELAARTLAVLDAHDVAYLLEAPDLVLGRPGVDERIRARLERGGVDPERILPSLSVQMRDDLSGASFAKVSCYDSPVPMSRIVAEIGPELDDVESSLPGGGHDGGEIFLRGIAKSEGARLVAEHLGVDRSAVIAVGDGMNDIDLIDYAGTGVAVEGSDPRVIAAAQRLAPPPQDNGLVTLFTELGLIEPGGVGLAS